MIGSTISKEMVNGESDEKRLEEEERRRVRREKNKREIYTAMLLSAEDILPHASL